MMRRILMIVLFIGLAKISSTGLLKNLLKKLPVSCRTSDGEETGKGESDPLDFMNDHLNAAKEEFDRKWENPVTCTDTVQSSHFIRELGSGSCGRVMLAEQMGTEEYYAIKVMDLGYIAQIEQSEPGFHANNEILISQAIHFPFLVKTECSFKDDTNIYLVMEYVCGADMQLLLTKRRKFKERDVKFYAAQLVLALHYLHSMNLIHRDLKLANVLIGRDGYIKVADFGLATRLTTPTRTQCGTPSYRAPELVAGKLYDKSVDWWMLGILLYRMSTGEPPFYPPGASYSELYRGIVHGEVDYPSGMPRNLKDLVKHLLVKDPQNRYGLVDVMRHKWFDDIDWKNIYEKKAKAPYVPKC